LKAITGKKPHNFAGIQKICDQCGESFYISPSRKDTKRFCSQRCYGLAQRVPGPRPLYKRITVNGKRVREHRHIKETELGYKLSPKEHVHHKNNQPLDNDPTNLEVLDIKKHGGISSRQRGIFPRQ
jgi:hypothetical protein